MKICPSLQHDRNPNTHPLVFWLPTFCPCFPVLRMQTGDLHLRAASRSQSGGSNVTTTLSELLERLQSSAKVQVCTTLSKSSCRDAGEGPGKLGIFGGWVAQKNFGDVQCTEESTYTCHCQRVFLVHLLRVLLLCGVACTNFVCGFSRAKAILTFSASPEVLGFIDFLRHFRLDLYQQR